jgi:hypothetical protein
MYAGTTFRRDSGRIVGVHQKIDRVARRHLKKYVSANVPFPAISKILHFEGKNGPDGIKRKSPAKDEPWHYIDPSKPGDRALLVMINDHIYNLTEALQANNEQRAAFEAAWLAHAVVDGLTPAHHYPLNDKIEQLWGKPHHERTTILDKNFIHGHNRRDTFAKNWEYWGMGGVFTAHFMFEWGVASVIAPETFDDCAPTASDIARLENDGFEAVFMNALRKIDKLKMYDEFGNTGWTHSLADTTKKVLVPEIIKTVCLAWYQAASNVKVQVK